MGTDEYRSVGVPDHIIRQIKRLRLNGVSVREIARLLQVSTSTVQKYASRPGDETEPNAH